MLLYRNVTKSYGSAVAVNDVSLEIPAGELCVLLGPSGCGKTTLLRMTNRLVEPSSGTIVVNGRDVMATDPVELRRGIGYVIQSIGLFPHRTVAENVTTTLQFAQRPASTVAARVDELLAMMNLEPAKYRDRYPAELSGGEQQRVGVARALAADPPVLLMDEPFGAIDPINRAEIREEFLALQQRLKKTIVFVSHDVSEAFFLADRIAVMRSGAIEQQGSPAEIARSPATEFVARFLGADRHFLLLDTLRAADALDPSVPEDFAPEDSVAETIAADSTLRFALGQLVGNGRTAVAVKNSAGETIGAVTIDSIRNRLASGENSREVSA